MTWYWICKYGSYLRDRRPACPSADLLEKKKNKKTKKNSDVNSYIASDMIAWKIGRSYGIPSAGSCALPSLLPPKLSKMRALSGPVSYWCVTDKSLQGKLTGLEDRCQKNLRTKEGLWRRQNRRELTGLLYSPPPPHSHFHTPKSLITHVCRSDRVKRIVHVAAAKALKQRVLQITTFTSW